MQHDVCQTPSKPAFPLVLRDLSQAFENKYGTPIPSAVQRVLRVTNGINFRGVLLWPAQSTEHFPEGLLDANIRLRSLLSPDFLYFGFRGDILYVFSFPDQAFQTVENDGLRIIDTFSDDEEMMSHLLQKALDT